VEVSGQLNTPWPFTRAKEQDYRDKLSYAQNPVLFRYIVMHRSAVALEDLSPALENYECIQTCKSKDVCRVL